MKLFLSLLDYCSVLNIVTVHLSDQLHNVLFRKHMKTISITLLYLAHA